MLETSQAEDATTPKPKATFQYLTFLRFTRVVGRIDDINFDISKHPGCVPVYRYPNENGEWIEINATPEMRWGLWCIGQSLYQDMVDHGYETLAKAILLKRNIDPVNFQRKKIT